MKLFLDGDEQSSPECLTLNFFSMLMSTESKKRGNFQLLSFKRKRDLVYSTKISDGFFEVKVMMVQQAAKQLERGELNNFFILDGWMRNHGQGVIVIKQKMQYWSHSKEIGNPIPWRLKKENVNGKGSNYIIWNSQQLTAIHGQEAKITISNRDKTGQSQIMLTIKHLDQQSKVEDVHKLNNAKKNQSRSLGAVTQTQSMSLISFSEDQNVEEKTNANKQAPNIIPKIEETQSIDLRCRSEGNLLKNNNEKLLLKKKENILSLIFDSDSEKQKEELKDKPISNKKSRNQQIQPKNTQKVESQKVQPVVDLRFILNCLHEEQELKKRQSKEKQKSQQQKKESDDQDDGFLQWLDHKKSVKQLASQSLKKSTKKSKQQMYKYLISSSDSDQSQQKSTKNHSSKQSNLHSQSLTRHISVDQSKMQIKFEDIYHGIFTKSSMNWWIIANLRCLSQPTSKDYVNTIISNQANQYLINVVFMNLSALQISLQEGKSYRLGKGIIKASIQHSRWNSSHAQIQFDCSRSFIEQIQDQNRLQEKQCSSNYQMINKLYVMEDGEIVNIFGILKSVRNILGKNGVISNYQIADPISKYSITMTQFDSKLSTESIPYLINTAITVYNASVSSYKGKKNILARPKTIIKHNWLPFTQEANLIRQWLKTQDNHIEGVDLNLIGFAECSSLSIIAYISSSQIFLKNVTVLDINSKFTYAACVKCLKKVQENRCRACGKRGPGQVIERLFLRGNIGDGTQVVNVLWANSIAEAILSEGFAAFEKKWALKKVSVWVERGITGSLTIVKIKELEVRQRISDLFEFIKKRFL